MVTVFLIASALINMAVGYWLAISLRRTGAAAESAGHDESLDVLAALPPAPMAAARPDMAPPADPAAVVPPAALSAVATNDDKLEQDVLAGIEEFRNQLAQMKSRGDGAEQQPATAPAVPAGAPA